MNRIQRLLWIFVFVLALSVAGLARGADLLGKYRVAADPEFQLVHVEEFSTPVEKINRLLVLDIEKAFVGNEPMDYTRVRVFDRNGKLTYIKKDFPGVMIGRTKALPVKIQEKNKKNIFFS